MKQIRIKALLLILIASFLLTASMYILSSNNSYATDESNVFVKLFRLVINSCSDVKKVTNGNPNCEDKKSEDKKIDCNEIKTKYTWSDILKHLKFVHAMPTKYRGVFTIPECKFKETENIAEIKNEILKKMIRNHNQLQGKNIDENIDKETLLKIQEKLIDLCFHMENTKLFTKHAPHTELTKDDLISFQERPFTNTAIQQLVLPWKPMKDGTYTSVWEESEYAAIFDGRHVDGKQYTGYVCDSMILGPITLKEGDEYIIPKEMISIAEDIMKANGVQPKIKLVAKEDSKTLRETIDDRLQDEWQIIPCNDGKEIPFTKKDILLVRANLRKTFGGPDAFKETCLKVNKDCIIPFAVGVGLPAKENRAKFLEDAEKKGIAFVQHSGSKLNLASDGYPIDDPTAMDNNVAALNCSQKNKKEDLKNGLIDCEKVPRPPIDKNIINSNIVAQDLLERKNKGAFDESTGNYVTELSSRMITRAILTDVLCVKFLNLTTDEQRKYTNMKQTWARINGESKAISQLRPMVNLAGSDSDLKGLTQKSKEQAEKLFLSKLPIPNGDYSNVKQFVEKNYKIYCEMINELVKQIK
ncbi:MAG: hypothetical protein HQK49_00640 [Oligoflexia bacterium]|nr:hypothetical protein [Oligoflexia bacterium]